MSRTATATVHQLPGTHRLRKNARNRKRTVSPDQQRQRELAWMLYITEGYIANVEHAVTVNSYTLDRKTLSLMRHVQRMADDCGRQLRSAMQP